MKHYVETQWAGKLQFNARVNGHTIIMDGPERLGGENNGPFPKPFLLTALTGCAGIDVVALLQNAGKQVNKFILRVEGAISSRPPKEYTDIHLVYELIGDQDLQQEVLHAITCSQEKTCGVSNMLRKIVPLSWEVLYNGEQIFSNKKASELAA